MCITLCIMLLQQYGSFTPLMLATEVGHSEIVSVLIQCGADLNLQDKVHGGLLNCCPSPCILYMYIFMYQRGLTALMKAVMKGHTSIVNILLESQADVNIQENVSVAQKFYEQYTVGVVDRL